MPTDLTAKRRMRAILLSGERRMTTKVNEWMDFMGRQVVKGLNKLIRKDLAMNIVDELTDFEVIEREGHVIVKPMILKLIGEAGDQAAKLAQLELTFDVLNPSAVELAETITNEMVREVTDETKKALRWVIREGVNEGKGIPKIAREIRPKVGLTERQMKSVANFEERLIKDRPELSRAQIDRRVGTYERRMHRRRAENIARTETSRAVSEGALMAYDEAGADVKWLTTAGACEICDPNDGKVFSIEEAQGLLPAHPKCRCAWSPAVAA